MSCSTPPPNKPFTGCMDAPKPEVKPRESNLIEGWVIDDSIRLLKQLSTAYSGNIEVKTGHPFEKYRKQKRTK